MPCCTYCGALPAPKRCSRCGALYCCRACQAGDWKSGPHRFLCAARDGDGRAGHLRGAFGRSCAYRLLVDAPRVHFLSARVDAGGAARAAAPLAAGEPITYVPVCRVHRLAWDDTRIAFALQTRGLVASSDEARHRSHFLGQFVGRCEELDPLSAGLPPYGSGTLDGADPLGPGWEQACLALAASVGARAWEALVDHWARTSAGSNCVVDTSAGPTVYAAADIPPGPLLTVEEHPLQVLQRCYRVPLRYKHGVRETLMLLAQKLGLGARVLELADARESRLELVGRARALLPKVSAREAEALMRELDA